MNLTLAISRPFLLSAVLALSFSFGASPVMANLFGKSELSGAWKERFQDVSKLNAYTDKGLKVEISDAVIEKYDLTGAVFEGATFRDNVWNETTGKKMTFTNTTFRFNTFNGVELEDSVFTNVTFEDSEFSRTSFYRSKLVGVKFIRCKFQNQSDFSTLKNSMVEFDHSSFDHTSFAESDANLTIRNSTLTNVRMIDLAPPSSLTFENSKLQDVDMDRSKLAKLVMDNVTGGGSNNGSSEGNITEVAVRNSEVGFGLVGGTLGKVTFVNSKIDVGFANAKIKELQINNCKSMADLGLYQAKVDTLQISNCPINNIRPLEAIIQHFRIDKSSIVNSDFGDMKATNFTLTDVTLDQQIDFTGAHVEHLTTKNVVKAPGLNLNLTDTNVKF